MNQLFEALCSILIAVACVFPLIYLNHLWLSYRQFRYYRGYSYKELTFRKYLKNVYFG